MNDLLIQILCYAALMILTIGCIGFLMRGFFWKFCKVKTSLGRLIMVKIKTSIRDYFEIGWVDEGFLVYKHKTKEANYLLRLAIPSDKNVFYRSIGVLWVDVDEEKNALMATDYTPVSGFDAKKFSDLLVRALSRPSIKSNFEKLITLLLFVVIVIAIIGVYFGYTNYDKIKIMWMLLQTLSQKVDGLAAIINTGSQNIAVSSPVI